MIENISIISKKDCESYRKNGYWDCQVQYEKNGIIKVVHEKLSDISLKEIELKEKLRKNIKNDVILEKIYNDLNNLLQDKYEQGYQDYLEYDLD